MRGKKLCLQTWITGKEKLSIERNKPTSCLRLKVGFPLLYPGTILCRFQYKIVKTFPFLSSRKKKTFNCSSKLKTKRTKKVDTTKKKQGSMVHLRSRVKLSDLPKKIPSGTRRKKTGGARTFVQKQVPVSRLPKKTRVMFN